MERGAAFLSETVTSPTVRRRHAQMVLSQDIGVGFWDKADAEHQAIAEERRTGYPHALHMEPTPGQTHAVWFVRSTSSDTERRVA